MTATNQHQLTEDQLTWALHAAARWLAPHMGYEHETPVGEQAANTASGPMLIKDWDWPSSGPAPTLILEGGPYDWAIFLAGDPEQVRLFAKHGIFMEPYASYALCLYWTEPVRYCACGNKMHNPTWGCINPKPENGADR